MIDFATLTGAARVALGPEVPAYFSNKQDLVERIMHTGILTGATVHVHVPRYTAVATLKEKVRKNGPESKPPQV